MKRLLRDLAVLLAVALLTLGLDKLGAYSALASLLETAVAAEAEAAAESPSLWPGESAPYLPPAPTPPPPPEAGSEGEELIASGLCDAVIICVPHYQHPPLAISAMRHGLHTMVEKPAGVFFR